ncbi:hypothetical protein Adt_35064 [Abeliophyllum distichum]|uniref:Uncharacterized protein n=1 Tax=Abeliophyllum distichum TaxID=126358 RepID=A0ABD1QDT7_9LAMI
MKVKRAEVEAKVMMSFKEEFPNTPEYLHLANLFMMADREQLVERIGEVHPECDISFLRHALADPSSPKDPAATKVPTSTKPQAKGEAYTTLLIIEEGLQCTSPGEVVGTGIFFFQSLYSL